MIFAKRMTYLIPSFLVILKFEADLIIQAESRYQDFCLLVFAFVSLDKQPTSRSIVLKYMKVQKFSPTVRIVYKAISC